MAHDIRFSSTRTLALAKALSNFSSSDLPSSPDAYKLSLLHNFSSTLKGTV